MSKWVMWVVQQETKIPMWCLQMTPGLGVHLPVVVNCRCTIMQTRTPVSTPPGELDWQLLQLNKPRKPVTDTQTHTYTHTHTHTHTHKTNAPCGRSWTDRWSCYR